MPRVMIIMYTYLVSLTLFLGNYFTFICIQSYAFHQVSCVTYFKAAPWDDINFRFYFRTEVVYPTDHVFIFFRIFIFLQIFLINISMKPEETQTNYLYT